MFEIIKAPTFYLILRPPVLLENEVLIKIAEKYKKSTAQVCLRWLIQRNIIALPKVACWEISLNVCLKIN